MNAPARSWEWKPSPFANAMISAMLRTPILHRLLGSRLLVLSFTGRKSGKHYTTPVGYYRQGRVITILTKRFRTWWHNFQQPSRVEVLLDGKTYQGCGQALTEEAAIIPIFTDCLTKNHSDASFFGVGFTETGAPDVDDIQRIASKVVVLQITLTD